MNIPLLRQIQKTIDKNPDRFIMSGFFSGRHKCGPACCIAGWAWVLDGNEYGDANLDPEMAARVLDISRAQSYRLFFCEDWPKEFHPEDIDDPESDPELPALAIKRIDHFIATEGRE